jgi:ATP-dependent Clp protease ATP-binding subunit ClpA
LTKEGFDPRYGARPLQRVLEMRVVSAVSRHLVRFPEQRGVEIRLDVDDREEVVVAA